ncbi:MAG TPA: histidine phosphatase family protein [Actinomycetota bacterium]|nr:histidine phosphatase family protein [Actinomycetota bacterium]
MALLLLIRHGVTATTGVRFPEPATPLSAEGLAQAERLVGRLEAVGIDAIYSSPLLRCRQTAEPLARARGLPVRVREDLADVRVGRWAGRRLAQVKRTRLWRLATTAPLATPFPGGESLLDTHRRAVGEVHAIAAAHPRATVAVVTHADVIRLALAHLLGAPVEAFSRLAIDPASVSVVRLDEGQPRVLRVNDTGSLDGLGPGRRRGDVRG